MSNTLIITPTCFVELDEDGEELERSWGIVASDSYASGYTSGMTREEIIGRKPAELVAMTSAISDEMADAVNSARDSASGIRIGNRFHDWASMQEPEPTGGMRP